jgi:hypothetical protein
VPVFSISKFICGNWSRVSASFRSRAGEAPIAEPVRPAPCKAHEGKAAGCLMAGGFAVFMGHGPMSLSLTKLFN